MKAGLGASSPRALGSHGGLWGAGCTHCSPVLTNVRVWFPVQKHIITVKKDMFSVVRIIILQNPEPNYVSVRIWYSTEFA